MSTLLWPELRTVEGSLAAAARCWQMMQRLYPVCRSITGRGVRETLVDVSSRAPLEITEIPSGTPVFDWEVPLEWNVEEAWIDDPSGRRVVDLRDHSLHLVSYSAPIDATMSLEELRPHLHTMPDHPDWIPYRTSYYRADWGFCLAHRVLETLRDGDYRVHIGSSLTHGHLTYGECVVRGESDEEVLVFTHVCHPSLCNDNLTGIAIAAELAAQLAQARPRRTFRFVFAPGTIGSICWLSRNEANLHRIHSGLVIGLLGDRGAMTYKRSRRSDAQIDRIAAHVLPRVAAAARLIDFSPYGYDERQLCSPGFDLPVGRLTRTPNGEYAEYHSSADDFALISEQSLAESLRACATILALADRDDTYVNMKPKCEPRLGKRGLYRATGGTEPGQFEFALLWILNQSDGSRSLLDIAVRSGLDFGLLAQAADALEKTDLLKRAESRGNEGALLQ